MTPGAEEPQVEVSGPEAYDSPAASPGSPAASPDNPSPELDAELGGYLEWRTSGQLGVTGDPLTFTERVRPSFEIAPVEGVLAGRLKAETVIEASLTEGRDAGRELADTLTDSELGPLLSAAGCSYDPEPRYASIGDVLSVERLHVDFNLRAVDIKVGRQAVRWGSGLFFHPTDLYAEVLLTEPWREPKGINAVRASMPIGADDVTAVVALGDDLSPFFRVAQGTAESVPFEDLPLSAAVKGTARFTGVDVAAVGQARADGAWFVGGDVRGTLGVGYWAEGGWHGGGSADGHAEVVAGADYSFPVLETLYLAAEYRYDGSGSAPGDYDYTSRVSGALPFDCAMMPSESTSEPRTTLGRHYLDGAVRLGLSRDVNVQAAALANLEDGTAVLIPGASVNASDRAVVSVSAQIPVGSGGEFRPAASDLTYTLGTASVDLSGLVPDATVTGWIRYSF